MSLIEGAAASWLTQDDVFLGLGRRRYVIETAALAERIIGDSLVAEDGLPRQAAAGS